MYSYSLSTVPLLYLSSYPPPLFIYGISSTSLSPLFLHYSPYIYYTFSYMIYLLPLNKKDIEGIEYTDSSVSLLLTHRSLPVVLHCYEGTDPQPDRP